MTGAPRASKNIVLLVATVTSFILPFLIAAVNIALPTIAREFSMEAVVMSWINTVYFLAIATMQVPLGRLSDIFGYKRFFILGLIISSLASFLGAMASSVAVLIVSRALQGLGAGITFNTSTAILTSVFPAGERGRALGISMAGTYLGLSLGPLIGGMMIQHFRWTSIFILTGVLGIMLLALALWGLKGEWRGARGERFDITGSLIFSISLAMFIYGFSELLNTQIFTVGVFQSQFPVPGYALCILGVLGLFAFTWWEGKASSPIFDLRLFRTNRTFFFANLSVLINYMATFAVTFLLSLYLQYIKGYSPQSAGTVLITSSVLMTVFTPLAGRISDKVEPRLVATAGMLLNCLALVLLVFLDDTTGLWYIIVTLLLYGTGIGFFSSPNTNAIMGSVSGRELAVASGTIGTMRTAGMMLSMGVMMILFSFYIGPEEITPVYYPAFLASAKTGFIIFTVLCIGGTLAQFFSRRPAKGVSPA